MHSELPSREVPRKVHKMDRVALAIKDHSPLAQEGVGGGVAVMGDWAGEASHQHNRID